MIKNKNKTIQYTKEKRKSFAESDLDYLHGKSVPGLLRQAAKPTLTGKNYYMESIIFLKFCW